MSENTNPEIIFTLKNQSIPYVQLDKFYDYGDKQSVSIDYKEASKNMTDYLISKGHEKILFANENEKLNIGKEKYEGYKQSMIEKGLNPLDINIDGTTDNDGYNNGKKIWDIIKNNNISAVFFSEDELALGFLNYCYDNDKNVPEEISVVGFGDIKISSKYRPRLTTVREPFYDYGAIAIRKIIKKLKDKIEIESGTILPSSVMERETVKKMN